MLKPFQKDELVKALNKFKQTVKTSPTFISYIRDQMIPIQAESVAYFYTITQLVYAVTEQSEFVLNEKLEEIEKQLPSELFFRSNRQFIIQKKYVKNTEFYFNNRLIVHLTLPPPDKIVISREKATSFKEWLIGK